jgi:hypothetical protein
MPGDDGAQAATITGEAQLWVAMTPPRPLRPMSRIAGAIMI